MHKKKKILLSFKFSRTKVMKLLVFIFQSPPENNQQNSAENLGHEVVHESPNDDTSNLISDEVGNMNNMTKEGGLDPSDQIGRPKRHRSQPKRLDDFNVYKVKYRPNGEVERYKARLVAKGFTRREGVDYHDTFAPVAKLVTVQTLLTMATKNNWFIYQLELDVNNVFLHGDFTEEVYMKIPHGFAMEGETKLCWLRKSTHGLKQASQNWYHKFTNAHIALYFKKSKADHYVFIYQQKETFVVALIYVDDVILVGNDLVKMQHTKTELNNRFSIKDLGNLKYFLGIEMARTPKGLVLTKKNTLWIFLQIMASKDPHLDAVHRVLRYLKSTPGQGVLLPRIGGYNLNVYCHSDWLGCLYTRRSKIGYILLLGGAPIFWKTKKQSAVSRSSAETEYRLMASTVSEVLWVRWLLQELNVAFAGPTPFICDNQDARHITKNHNADLLTKGLGTLQLRFLLDKLGSRDLHAPT
nr:hypothetical protein [Tanacetum cinerariifolium]